MQMHRIILAVAASSLLLFPALAEARGGGLGGGHSAASAPAGYSQSSARCASCSRDSNGHIARSEGAKHAFEVEIGNPHGRPATLSITSRR